MNRAATGFVAKGVGDGVGGGANGAVDKAATGAVTKGVGDGSGDRAEDGAGDGTAAVVTSHDADIHFTFVLQGGMRLRTSGREAQDLRAGDAFAVPPRTRTACERCTADLELLEVSLPGRFETTVHDGFQ